MESKPNDEEIKKDFNLKFVENSKKRKRNEMTKGPNNYGIKLNAKKLKTDGNEGGDKLMNQTPAINLQVK